MSVLCQFDVFLCSDNLLIISNLSSRLCRMSVVFAFFVSHNYFLLADSCPFPSLIAQITQIFLDFLCRFKIIYYYDELEDIIHLIDIWDTRMDPKALIRRIK